MGVLFAASQWLVGYRFPCLIRLVLRFDSVYGSAGGVGEDREGGSQGRRRERNLAEDEQNEEVVCPEKGNTEEWANFVLQSVEAPQWVGGGWMGVVRVQVVRWCGLDNVV